jgi:hypothetical protein
MCPYQALTGELIRRELRVANDKRVGTGSKCEPGGGESGAEEHDDRMFEGGC